MKSRKTTRWLWQIADSTLELFIFFPSMVFYWRGIWDLFGAYISPEDQLVNNWAVFGIGCGAILGYFFHPLVDYLTRDLTNRVYFVIVTRVYMYLFGVLLMAYWRGVWTLADYYLLKFGWQAGLAGLLICHPILILSCTSRSIIFSPFVVNLDTRPDVLKPSTTFGTQVNWHNGTSVFKYFLDSCVTHFIMITVSIVMWRSGMTLCDYIMFDEDAVWSNVMSLIVGVVGCVTFFALEIPLATVSYGLRNHRLLKLAWEDAIFTLIFFVEIFLWRGGWNLNTMFILSDPKIGGWVNHCLGTIFLMSLQVFSYAGGCGCALDYDPSASSEPDVMFNTKYLRHYLRRRIYVSQESDATTCSKDVANIDTISSKCQDNGVINSGFDLRSYHVSHF